MSVNVFSHLFPHISFVFWFDFFPVFDNLTTQIKMKDYKMICVCVQSQLDDVRGSKHHWEDTRPETAIVHTHLMDCCFCGASQWSNHEPCLEKKNRPAKRFFITSKNMKYGRKKGSGLLVKWLNGLFYGMYDHEVKWGMWGKWGMHTHFRIQLRSLSAVN